jgi:hypothetical protein
MTDCTTEIEKNPQQLSLQPSQEQQQQQQDQKSNEAESLIPVQYNLPITNSNDKEQGQEKNNKNYVIDLENDNETTRHHLHEIADCGNIKFNLKIQLKKKLIFNLNMLVIYDEQGERHTMGEIWKEFKTIFVFVRVIELIKILKSTIHLTIILF